MRCHTPENLLKHAHNVDVVLGRGLHVAVAPVHTHQGFGRLGQDDALRDVTVRLVGHYHDGRLGVSGTLV